MKMKGSLLSAAEAAAHGARLSAVDVLCTHPAPFVMDIAGGLKGTPVIETDSFFSALNAAIGSGLGGRRAFAVSSPLTMSEDVHVASWMRLPFVLFNVSTSPGTFSIRHDHSDVLAARDAGWLIFMPESSQEVIDMIVQAYKVCEDGKVLLPGVVSVDMPHCREPVHVPNEKFTRRYVGRFRHSQLGSAKKQYINVPGQDHAAFRKQQHRAVKNALEVVEKTSAAWKKKTGRSLAAVESYRMDGAEYAIVISGFHSATAKAAVNRLRNEGKRVGLLRIRVVRPWPAEAVRAAVKDVKRVAVLDQAVSLGSRGILYSEMTKYISGSDFISMGKHPSEKDFAAVFSRLISSGGEELVWL